MLHLAAQARQCMEALPSVFVAADNERYEGTSGPYVLRSAAVAAVSTLLHQEVDPGAERLLGAIMATDAAAHVLDEAITAMQTAHDLIVAYDRFPAVAQAAELLEQAIAAAQGTDEEPDPYIRRSV
jgi:hypothetical protein